ncbi:hypothetical protein Vadar_022444 [Vaccinium darrowii]|uniref:Uncharacterized protein n=1 Tax=Vaccinium darrowii TaxID=229202 RepID=A0ACB7YHE0_9ERIC|nr:hypothetical protein Vadar_022444 [Vaccinium darrowii]
MEGDVIELGETTKILNKSMTPVDHVSSVAIVEEEAAKEISKAAACVMFEKPTPKAANHIKPLYVLGCLDGMPVNRLLIDDGSVANLMPRTTMTKSEKTEQDLIASSASLLDFKGGLTSCEGILIMKLTVGTKTLTTPFFIINSLSTYNVLLGRDWIHACVAVPSSFHQCLIFWNGNNVEVVWADQKPFLATTNHAEVRLYDSDIGPMRVACLDKYGRHKIVTLTSKSLTEDLKKMMDLHEEEERPNSANATKFIYEDEGLEKAEEADEGDVIRFEDLEAAPAKLDDLKADVQYPLDEINLGESDIGLNAYEVALKPWKLLFDGSKAQEVSGCGIILISPEGLRTNYHFNSISNVQITRLSTNSL